jgi:fused signal recognition particle receptor
MFRWFEKKSKPAEVKSDVTHSSNASSTATLPKDEPGSLKSAISLTGRSLIDRISDRFGHAFESREDFEDALETVEEALLRSDIGPSTALDIVDALRPQQNTLTSPEQLASALRREFENILAPYSHLNGLSYTEGVMNIVLVTGVNGAGKTTFIGKLAHRFIQEGKKVVIGAGDTFRAAAEEQLEVWAQRSGAEFVGMLPTRRDPAAVIFDALKQAKAVQADVLLLDTAGRLQNKANLMAELQKIKRVIDQEIPADATLQSFLVLDATTGQNALSQASIFKEAVGLNGVILTKLDGSAKGGIVLTIAKEHQLPIKLVGTGEGIEDLRDFNTSEFIEGLFAGRSQAR